ncbi:MAG: hypothetical protein CMI26_00770 [Opitutae bacterium]|nr:hypothetical protein [Opitutae bacterium]
MHCHDYAVTRRSFIKDTMGVATLLGMPVGSLLAAKGTAAPAKAEHVILFWNGGGMSHIDTWDPKPGRPTQGEFEPIKTSADGVQISEIFPQLANQMHHCSLIRSIAGTNGDHGRATYELQTGYGQSANLVHPGLGSMVVHEKERLGDLPAFVSVSGQAPRAGYLGQKCAAYFVGQPGEPDPYLKFPAGISEIRGNKRLDVLARMNRRSSAKYGAKAMKANESAVEDAVALMSSPALKAFELKHENPKNIERYGDTDFGRGALMAKRLVETGVRFVQVNRGGFDTHSNNFEAMRAHGEIMDPGLASLIEDLASSGLLEKTLVLMLSEFGRTPRINENAGRDHHAKVFSCFLAGGGVKGGQIIGSSDEDGVMPAERPVKPHDIHASVCHSLGIDGSKEVMTPLDRPMRLIREGGEPVNELFV